MNRLKTFSLRISRNFWIFVIFMQLAGIVTVAQRHYHFYYGKVTEQGTTAAIPNVNLSFAGSRTGTVTDKNGAFSFYIDSLPATLVVSHVGYETKTILLDETSYSLTLYLSRKTSELQEVEIKANVQEAFFKDEHYAVLDYEIDSNLVYLLIYRQRLSKAELICKNLAGDTVATSIPFYFTPARLFRSVATPR